MKKKLLPKDPLGISVLFESFEHALGLVGWLFALCVVLAFAVVGLALYVWLH